MAASAWQKLFPDGRGLLNGNHLNRIFTGAAKVSAMEMGTLIVDGAFTATGGSVISGQQKRQIGTSRSSAQSPPPITLPARTDATGSGKLLLKKLAR